MGFDITIYMVPWEPDSNVHRFDRRIYRKNIYRS